MEFLGRFHPVLVHFPIALVIAAAVAESAAIVTHGRGWRIVAVANVRAGAVSGLLAAAAGWRMAALLGLDATPVLEGHRWTGTIAAALTLVAAVAISGAHERSRLRVSVYRAALFVACVLVAVAGHSGGLLVWGDGLLHP
jgi:uncharacterized membrane protein